MAHSTHHGHGRSGPRHPAGRSGRRDARGERRPDHRGERRQDHRGERRQDHRRGRRLRRRGVPAHPVAAVALVCGAVLLAGTAVAVVLTVLAQILAVLLVGLLLVGAWTVLRGAARRPAPAQPAGDPAVTAERAWRSARADFQRVRAEFAAHETDPMAVLHRPALSDVTVPSTARFVDAFAAAQALDTDGYPGEPYGDSYLRAVERARNAWRAAVEAADRIRLSGLTADERRTVERVVKLLTTARDSDSEPERLAAYARARTELDRLDRAGTVHLPAPARAHLDARARGELPGG